MECEELYDALNNLELLEQELPLEDFGDCKLKFKPYVGMQFDSLDGVKTFYKDLQKKKVLKSVFVLVRDHLEVII